MSAKKFTEAAQRFEASKSRAIERGADSGMTLTQTADVHGKPATATLTRETPALDGRGKVTMSTTRDYGTGEIVNSIVQSRSEPSGDGVKTFADVKTHMVDDKGNEFRDEYKSETLTQQGPEGTLTQGRVLYPDGTTVESATTSAERDGKTHSVAMTELRTLDGATQRTAVETVSQSRTDSAGNVFTESQSRVLSEKEATSMASNLPGFSSSHGASSAQSHTSSYGEITSVGYDISSSAGINSGVSGSSGSSRPESATFSDSSKQTSSTGMSHGSSRASESSADSGVGKSMTAAHGPSHSSSGALNATDFLRNVLSEAKDNAQNAAMAISLMRDVGMSREEAVERSFPQGDLAGKAQLNRLLDKAGYDERATHESSSGSSVASAHSSDSALSLGGVSAGISGLAGANGVGLSQEAGFNTSSENSESSSSSGHSSQVEASDKEALARAMEASHALSALAGEVLAKADTASHASLLDLLGEAQTGRDDIFEKLASSRGSDHSHSVHSDSAGRTHSSGHGVSRNESSRAPEMELGD